MYACFSIYKACHMSAHLHRLRHVRVHSVGTTTTIGCIVVKILPFLNLLNYASVWLCEYWLGKQCDISIIALCAHIIMWYLKVQHYWISCVKQLAHVNKFTNIILRNHHCAVCAALTMLHLLPGYKCCQATHCCNLIFPGTRCCVNRKQKYNYRVMILLPVL